VQCGCVGARLLASRGVHCAVSRPTSIQCAGPGPGQSRSRSRCRSGCAPTRRVRSARPGGQHDRTVGKTPGPFPASGITLAEEVLRPWASARGCLRVQAQVVPSFKFQTPDHNLKRTQSHRTGRLDRPGALRARLVPSQARQTRDFESRLNPAPGLDCHSGRLRVT
jgi:hypothetical protein